MIDWIKIDGNNLPPQGKWVIITDGKEWKRALVTKQFEFVDEKYSRLVYRDITHFANIELPE